jgi:hypothetical protein
MTAYEGSRREGRVELLMSDSEQKRLANSQRG